MSLELSSVLGDSSSSTCFLSLWPRDLNFPGENVDSNHLFSDSVNREIYKCQYDKTMVERINSVHCVLALKELCMVLYWYYFFRCSH